MAVGQVEFVQAENPGLDDVVDEAVDHVVFGSNGARGIDDVDDDIDSFERVTDFVVKVLDQLAGLGLEDAGRVHKNDLPFGAVDDAVDGFAGGLRFGGDDGDLGAHQRVEQRGLADIGAADQHGEAAFEVGCGCHQNPHHTQAGTPVPPIDMKS